MESDDHAIEEVAGMSDADLLQELAEPLADDSVEDSAAAAVAESAGPDEMMQKNLERLREYELEALAYAESFKSSLAVANCSFMKMLALMTPTIIQLMSGPAAPERTQQMLKLTDTALRLGRQIDRFADAERRDEERLQARLRRFASGDVLYKPFI